MSPEEIVRALAAGDPPTDEIWCFFCLLGLDTIEDLNDPAQHKPSCLWRLAREWQDAAEIGWEERERLGLAARPDYSGLSGRRVGSAKDPYP